jgi:hypothetical protein
MAAAGIAVQAQNPGDPVITAGPSSLPAPAFVGDTLRFQVAATDPDNDSLCLVVNTPWL